MRTMVLDNLSYMLLGVDDIFHFKMMVMLMMVMVIMMVMMVIMRMVMMVMMMIMVVIVMIKIYDMPLGVVDILWLPE